MTDLIKAEALEDVAEQKAEASARLIKLDHNVAFYVPSTIEIDHNVADLEAAARAEDVAATLAKLFGGATIYKAFGAWLDSSGRLILEDVAKVVSFAAAEDLAAHYDTLISLAEEKRRTWKQESIALEIDNSLLLV